MTARKCRHRPRRCRSLLDWAKAHPGRFTYPQPPDFFGLTFLKQVLVDLSADKSVLQQPATDANFDTVTAPLWAYMDELRPYLWRQGKSYPKSGPDQRQLLSDGEVDIALSFTPFEAATSIAQGLSAGDRACLCAGWRHDRQYELRRHSLQRRWPRKAPWWWRISCSRRRPRPAPRTPAILAPSVCSISPS